LVQQQPLLFRKGGPERFLLYGFRRTSMDDIARTAQWEARSEVQLNVVKATNIDTALMVRYNVARRGA
jgi:hypothetical protein